MTEREAWWPEDDKRTWRTELEECFEFTGDRCSGLRMIDGGGAQGLDASMDVDQIYYSRRFVYLRGLSECDGKWYVTYVPRSPIQWTLPAAAWRGLFLLLCGAFWLLALWCLLFFTRS